MLNLGSSSQVARGWNNIDSSWLIRLSKHRQLSRALHRVGLLSPERYERIKRIDSSVICWDLRRGIPFKDECFDVVYHSHLLEHIDRDAAVAFLTECRRVLKKGGIIRIVVPDLECLARRYLDAMDRIPEKGFETIRHEAVCGMIDQMVLRTPVARSARPMLVRIAETVLVGDTARSGELHRWMYDRVSLEEALSRAGFREFCVVSPHASAIAGWESFYLDVASNGCLTKEDSIYVEARR